MPRNSRNPENPYSNAIDQLSEFNLLVILEYIEHKGGPRVLASLSIGKIPGLLEVMYYIDHESSIGNRRSDVFDFFHIDRTNLQTALSEDTQELVYTLDDSEDTSGAASHGLPGYLQEQPSGIVESQHAIPALSAMNATGPLTAYLDDETATERTPVPLSPTWHLPAFFFSCGVWAGPQDLFAFLQGSDANPFSM